MIMKPTTQQLDEQVELERTAISHGLKRLQDQTIKLEDQSYGSATIYGVSSIQSLLPRVVKKIDDTNLKIHKGTFGYTFREIHYYLKDIDSKSAAVISCKVAFDKIWIQR